MSEVKVNKISPRTGTTFTIGDSGDTVTTAGNISANSITASNSITLNGEAITALQNPTISSISPDTITNAQTSITITGANFVSVPIVEAQSSTGVIVPAEDEDALYEKTRSLMQDEEMRIALSKEAREYVENTHSIETIEKSVRDLLDLYSRV